MKTAVDERLRRETARFALRFACEDCAHCDERIPRCSLGYPLAPRRDAMGGSSVEFCKEFELA